MKIGIVTLYGDNYGNKLQNYAMQVLLRNQGCEAVTFRVKGGTCHQPTYSSDSLRKLAPGYMKQVVSSRMKGQFHRKNARDSLRKSITITKSGAYEKLRQQRLKAFDRFSSQYISVSDHIILPGAYEEPEVCDAYIAGSDQVWNPNAANGAYFLSFAPEYKRIAVSPSFGTASIPEFLCPAYRKWLSEIPHLSCREDKGADLIHELTGRDAPVLPDPTMAVDRAVWERIEKRPAYDIPEKYVLTYFLGNETDKYRKYIEDYAAAHNCVVIDLLDWQVPQYYATAPDEFLWLIHHAEIMMTDSFHGMVFSILFHTPFIAFDRVESGGMAMSSRIETLLKKMHLEHRRFGDCNKACSFEQSDECVTEERRRMQSFLCGALEDVRANYGKDNRAFVRYLENKVECSGCAACANACPKQCIHMLPDNEGFLYPHIDDEMCIHCGRCERVCPALHSVENLDAPQAYAGFNRDPQVKAASSSGGIFSVLAEEVLSQGGVVYGAGFDKDFSVVHRSAETLEDLSSLQGSKYVQSSIGAIYAEARQKLEEGRAVYFSGTPCQIEGLLNYLGKEYSKLYTQDIICHGVPSPTVWQAYCAAYAKNGAIRSASFRDKTYGWHYFSLRLETGKRKYICRLDEDPYIRLFLANIDLRPSCYACKFKKTVRPADLTIADCWNARTTGCTLPDDDTGLSMIFANTEKGKKLLEGVKSKCVLQSIEFEKAISAQSAMTKSVSLNPNREVFFANAATFGMEHALKEWFGDDTVHVAKAGIGFVKYKAICKIKKALK